MMSLEGRLCNTFISPAVVPLYGVRGVMGVRGDGGDVVLPGDDEEQDEGEDDGSDEGER